MMPEGPKKRLYRLLRWSERYTNLDMVYFASGGFWQTFGQVGSSLLSLVLILVFANLLPKETYGTYRYLISLAGILNIFTLTGMNQAVSQAVARGQQGILRATVNYQLKWNSLLMLVFWVAGAYYLVHENWAYGGALFILSVCTPLIAAFNTYSAYLSGRREFRLNNIFSVLATAIYVAGMVAAIILSGGVIWLVAAYAFSTLVGSVFFYVLTLRKFPAPDEPAGEVLKYGRHLTYIGLLAPLASQLDSVILNHFWGPAQLAVYSIATSIPNRAVPFVKSWVDVGFPKVAQKTPEELNRTFYQRIGLGLVAGATIAAAYILVAPYLFKYLMPQYIDAVIYTQILSIMFIFAIPNRYIGSLLAAQKMSRQILAVNIMQSMLAISLYIVLGIWGGIMGLVIAQAIYAGLGLLISASVWRTIRPQNT